MISEKEQSFIDYWQDNRVELDRPAGKILRGMPIALLFVLPILLLVIGVYIFSPDWYTKVAPMYSGTFYVIFIALFICSVFIAYFRMQFKWEHNEQYYKEILHRLNSQSSD